MADSISKIKSMSHNSTKSILIVIFFLYSFSAIAQDKKQMATEAFCIGEIQDFQSEILDEKRRLNIYLPPSYYTSQELSFPVIYLLDGSSDEDFIHIVGLVQFGAFPWVKMLPECIVVGIANTDRMRDYTFPTSISADKLEYPSSGQSEKFIECIENEIQPLIEENYRTKGSKTLIGQSLGGLLASEILIKKPYLFSHYIIVSPSLWWDNQSLLMYNPMSGRVPIDERIEVYVCAGNEHETIVKDSKFLVDRISVTHSPFIQSTYYFFGDQDHGNILHLAVYMALESMFSY